MKPEELKITPETKIKDIIPEGYELYDQFYTCDTDYNYKDMTITLKKKEKATFNIFLNPDPIKKRTQKEIQAEFEKIMNAKMNEIESTGNIHKYHVIDFKHDVIKYIIKKLIRPKKNDIPEEVEKYLSVECEFYYCGLTFFARDIGFVREEKDFEWYIEKYLSGNLKGRPLGLPQDIQSYIYNDFNTLQRNFKTKTYCKIPFEIRIGLLKFICDDMFPEYGIMQLILDWKIKAKTKMCFHIVETCPIGFLESLNL